MPYKSEKIGLSKDQDRRRKLSDYQRSLIIRLYKDGGTFRGLAREFKVDRKTIKNIIRPDLYKKQLEKYKQEQHWKKYYNREKNTEIKREHRRYKQNLYKLGQLRGGVKI